MKRRETVCQCTCVVLAEGTDPLCEPGGPPASRGAKDAQSFLRHLELDAAPVVRRTRPGDEAHRLEAGHGGGYPWRRHSLPLGEPADADPAVRPDGVQEGRLPSRDSERAELTAQVTRQLENERSKLVRETNCIIR